MKRVLVTGANGHIGANTVRSLLKRNYQVVPMVRKGADLRGIEKLGIDYVYGDILDYDAVVSALKGCDVVVHHASVYKMWVQDRNEILQPAIDGTENIFKAANETGVERIVYTSSMAAIGFANHPDQLRTPNDWNQDPHSNYYCAKTISEHIAVELSEKYGIPTIRLCPTLVLGPLDYRLTPSTKSLLDLINGTQTTYEGGLNYVHVFDVAEAHAQAIEKGDPGSRFIVGGENVHLKQVATLIYNITGHKPVHLGVTGPIAELTGAILGGISRITNKPPPYDRAVVKDMVGRYGYFDCNNTNEVFSLRPRGAEEVVQDTVRWLLFLGLIKPRAAKRITMPMVPDKDW